MAADLPVPRGTANTGGAVVLAPDNNYKRIDALGPVFQRAAYLRGVNDAKAKVDKAKIEAKNLDDFAKWGDQKTFHPFELEVQEDRAKITAKAHQYVLGNNNNGLLPSQRMELDLAKSQNTQMSKKSEQISAQLRDGVALINKLGAEGLDIPEATQHLNNAIKNKDGSYRKLSDITETEFASKILADHTLYDDKTVFAKQVKALGDVKNTYQNAGGPGGVSTRKSMQANVPFLLDANGNMMRENGTGKFLYDTRKLWNSTEGNNILRGKILDYSKILEARILEEVKSGDRSRDMFLTQDEINKKMKGTDLDEETFNQRVDNAALNMAVDEKFAPYISTDYQSVSHLNRQPSKKATGAGNEASDAQLTFLANPKTTYQYTDSKTGEPVIKQVPAMFGYARNVNNTSKTGTTKVKVIPGQLYYNPETGHKIEITTGFNGVAPRIVTGFRASKDFVWGHLGKQTKVMKGDLVQARWESANDATEFYSIHAAKLDVVLLEQINAEEPSSTLVSYKVSAPILLNEDGGYQVNATGTPLRGKVADPNHPGQYFEHNQIVTVQFGSEEYDALVAKPASTRKEGFKEMKDRKIPKGITRVDRVLADVDILAPEGKNLSNFTDSFNEAERAYISKNIANMKSMFDYKVKPQTIKVPKIKPVHITKKAK